MSQTVAHASWRPLTSFGMTTQESGGIFSIMRARLTKDFTFEAAQTLPNAPEGHKCRGVHGHSFKVEVSVEGDVDPKFGWIYDHAKISDSDETASENAGPLVSQRYRRTGESDD